MGQLSLSLLLKCLIWVHFFLAAAGGILLATFPHIWMVEMEDTQQSCNASVTLVVAADLSGGTIQHTPQATGVCIVLPDVAYCGVRSGLRNL